MEKALQWCWVTKCLSQITFDGILRRQVELLEQLGRDGYAASCPNSLQRRIVVHVHVVHMICVAVLTIGVAVLGIAEVLL